MNNPYDILKISPGASKAEIDAAYYRLINEYKNEENGDSVTADIAEYKINELKTAYNQLTNQLKSNDAVMGQVSSNKINPYYNAVTGTEPPLNDFSSVNEETVQAETPVNNPEEPNKNDSSENSQNTENHSEKIDSDDIFSSIRQFIDLGKYSEAENLLNSITYKDTAVWHYLYGKMCLGRGWMNQASVHFDRAAVIAPENEEYRQEMLRIRQMKLDKKSKIPVVPIVIGVICIGSSKCLPYSSICFNQICDDVCFEHMCEDVFKDML